MTNNQDQINELIDGAIMTLKDLADESGVDYSRLRNYRNRNIKKLYKLEIQAIHATIETHIKTLSKRLH